MADDEKPYKGTISSWYAQPCGVEYGLGYLIWGTFDDHPEFAGHVGHTSYVVVHNKDTGEIETRNSRYKLIGEAVA